MEYPAILTGPQQNRAAAIAAAEALKPFTHSQERLCRLVKQEKSSVIILTGGAGCGKTTLIPAVVANSGPDMKCIVAHPNLLVARTTYNWMSSNRKDRFAGGNMSGRVELVKAYRKGNFGDIYDSTNILTFTTDSILSDFITNDPDHGLVTLAGYSVVFLDEIYVRSLAMENILLRIKGIMEKRDSQKRPIHFVITSTCFDSTQLEAFFEIQSDHVVNLGPRNDEGSSGITHHYATLADAEKEDRATQVEVLLDKHVADRLEAKKNIGIVVFVTTRGMRAVKSSYRDAERYDASIRLFFLSEEASERSQDEAINAENKIVFCTDTISIGLTVLHVDTVIISGVREAPIWDSDVGQIVYTGIDVSASDVEQQAHMISKVNSRRECFYLFTQDTLKNMFRYRPSELDTGDHLIYMLMLYELYPGTLPVEGKMRLITYSPEYHILLQTSRLRALGLICPHPGGNGYHPTEIGHRVIKMPVVNGLARVWLGYLDPDAPQNKLSWYINMACILAYPDREVVWKKHPASYLKDDEMESVSFMAGKCGDLLIEHVCFETPPKHAKWKGIKGWGQFLRLNMATFDESSPSQQLVRSLKSHFGKTWRDGTLPPVAAEEIVQFVGVLCRVLQWNWGATSRFNGGMHIKHHASGYIFDIDPSTFINWNEHWVDDGNDMIYLKLSQIGSTYIASRFCVVQKPSMEVFLKSQNLENLTLRQLWKQLALNMTPGY